MRYINIVLTRIPANSSVSLTWSKDIPGKLLVGLNSESYEQKEQSNSVKETVCSNSYFYRFQNNGFVCKRLCQL